MFIFFSACDHCLDCPLSGECLLCEDGYIVNDDGTCQPCIDIEKDETTCKQCTDGKIGRFFKDDVCLCKERESVGKREDERVGTSKRAREIE